jgi:hypothetical protein
MQKLKSEFETDKGKAKGNAKNVEAQRAKLSKELTDKLEQLKSSRN